MRHDIYRFVVERPLQATEPDDRTLIVTRAWRPPPQETQLHATLRQAVRAGSSAAFRTAALAHAGSPRYLADWETAGPKLRGLEALLLRTPSPAFADVRAVIAKLADGRAPSEFAAAADFVRLREEIADTLLALVALRSDLDQTKSAVLRMMQLVGLVEWIARHETDVPEPTPEIVARAAASVVLIPPDLYPLPPEGRAVRPLAMEAAASAPMSGARIAGRAAMAGGAVRELVAAAAHPTQDGRIGNMHWNVLSDRTRTVLSSLGIQPGHGLVEAVEAVERADVSALPDDGPMVATYATTAAPSAAMMVRPFVVVPAGLDPMFSVAAAAPGMDTATAAPGAATIAVGAADLFAVRRVKTEYELGELAHVENVMATEHRARKHRFETESETETERMTETESESMRDLSTSETMELETEIASESSSSMDVEANFGLKASYGDTLTVSADFGVQSSTSSSNSQRLASRSSRETTERVATRLRTRTTERRRSRTRMTTTEENRHGFDNPGPDHIVGMYRWIDRVDTLDLYAYGRRLLVEFNVPEPAAFWRYQELINASSRLPPAPPAFEYQGNKITASTVHQWSYRDLAALFEAQGVEPPPPALVSRGGSWSAEAQDPQTRRSFYASIKDTIAVPDGYRAISFRAHLHQSQWLAPNDQPAPDATISTQGPGGGPSRFSIGDLVYSLPQGISATVEGAFTSRITGAVPVGLLAQGTTGYVLTAELFCSGAAEAYTIWQQRTFDQLLGSWRAMQSEWAAAVQRLMSREGVVIGGRNPGENVQIVRNELRRWILELMTLRDSAGNSGMQVPDPVESAAPDLDPIRAAELGQTISFVEQAFEWPLMSWRFHPYFWATQDRWTKLLAETDPDPAFQAFLRAGAARVVVPVRRGWDQQVGHFLATNGDVWGGGSAPQVDQSLFLSIAGEAVEPDVGVRVDQPSWAVRIPTSLVALDVPGLLMPSVTYAE